MPPPHDDRLLDEEHLAFNSEFLHPADAVQMSFNRKGNN
jgi:hypothetical protein